MAYETFYRLKCEPFAVQPDPRFYFNSPQHAVAREYLLHAAERGRGLALLLGEIGTGKTTLSRRILTELEADERYHIGMVVLTHSIRPRWLLEKIATLLDIEYLPDEASELFSMIVNRLFEIYNAGNKAVIFIDEANKIDDPETLEEIRGFINLETAEGDKLVTFILLGLPDLEVNLAQNAATVTSFSGGRPRLVNIICDNALIEGYIQRKPNIDEFIIERVAKNLNLIPKELGS
jgi:type II secretory pathway predicted ATPase ExeA